MAEVKQISAVQRAQNFAAATRQNLHMLPSRTVTNLGDTVQFTYPKSRLLSKTFVKVEVTTDVTSSPFKTALSPYDIIRRISLSLNNGFEPFVINGRDLALLNMVRMNPSVVEVSGSSYGAGINAPTSSLISEGADSKGKFSFMIELENTLNQRDASSLILLQNESTNVTLSIDLATNINSIFGKDANLVECKITPMLQTWTIPNYTDAFPDLSVLKLVKSRTETISGDGEHIQKLDVGTIYRKLVLYFTDENGNGKNIVNSNIEFIYNTADTPISIDPEMLRYKNTSDFGFEFPEGMYVFDMSGYAGFSNYGGTRDFIDTERLTEFWVRYATSEGGKVTVIQENLSRLR